MKRFALASLCWLCACGSSQPTTHADRSDETGGELTRLRAENEALRAENEALRRESTASRATDAPSPISLAELEPLPAVCVAIVTVAGLAVRYGDRHPELVSARMALLDAQARLLGGEAEGRLPDVDGARSMLAVMLAEERMSPAARGELGPGHPASATWRARASALTALITELESSRTCTPPE
jgi:hypothetical protein